MIRSHFDLDTNKPFSITLWTLGNAGKAGGTSNSSFERNAELVNDSILILKIWEDTRDKAIQYYFMTLRVSGDHGQTVTT